MRLEVSVSDWLVVDGVLDNVVAVASQDGEDTSEARALREAGWAASREHPEVHLGTLGWPPSTASLELDISQENIDYVTSCLNAEIDVVRGLLASRRLPEPQERVQQESLDLLLRVSDKWTSRSNPPD